MKEQYKNIGKEVLVDFSGMHVKVKILDYKWVYGCDRYLVTPVAGSGEIWVERVIF